MPRSAAIAIAMLVVSGCALDDSDDDGATVDDGVSSTAPSVIQHVFVIALENHADSSIYSNTTHAPFIQTLLVQGSRASLFVDNLPDAPSEPHYVWMEAGTNAFADHTFTGDGDPSSSNITSSTAHLSTQIDAAGSTWMSYQEGINSTTGACPVKSSGNYAAKHDPFVFFEDVVGTTPSRTNALCAAHHKALTALASDLANDTVAAYNFITPNLCHDMHSNLCSGFTDPVKQGDTWLSQNVPAIVDYANAHNGAVFIVWDEPEGSTGNIPLIVLGSHVKHGKVSSTKYSHSSLVKTMELILKLPVLPTVTHANSFRNFFETGFFP